MISLESHWLKKTTISESEWNDIHGSYTKKKSIIEKEKECLMIKEEKESLK